MFKQLPEKLRSKKGLQNVGQVLSFGITLGVTIIALAYFLLVHADVQQDIETEAGENSAAANASAEGVETITNLTDRMPTIATIGIAVLLISLLVGGFMFLQNRT